MKLITSTTEALNRFKSTIQECENMTEREYLQMLRTNKLQTKGRSYGT